MKQQKIQYILTYNVHLSTNFCLNPMIKNLIKLLEDYSVLILKNHISMNFV